MADKAKRNRRRQRLWWEQGGRCHWCDGQMTLDWPTASGTSLPDNAATIEHLNDRFSPERRTRPANGEQRWVLACRLCNHERGRRREAEQPREELWRRSGCMPGRATLADVWPRQEAAE